MRTLTTSLLAVPAIFLTAAATAQTVTFEEILAAGSANDITPDGRFIVGETISGVPYRLDTTTDEMLILPIEGMAAVAVSDDGSAVLGNIPDPEGIGSQVAAIWRGGTGWSSLGALPNALGCPSRSTGYELSADGSVATGLSWDGCSGRGFVWTHTTGMLELEGLANGSNRASVISADGTLIAGFAQGSFSRTPATWDAATQVGMLLDPPDGDAVGEVRGMRDDGSVLLGNWNEDAFKWTEAGGMEILGNGQLIPTWVGAATDIADDGTIVGFDFLLGNRQAWLQPGGAGDLVRLRDWVLNHGATLPPGYVLEVCQAITPDGRTIIGHGSSGAWKITITPETCDGDVDADNEVGFSDLLAVLSNWGACTGCPQDIDGDDMVGFSDLLIVLSNWGPCP